MNHLEQSLHQTSDLWYIVTRLQESNPTSKSCVQVYGQQSKSSNEDHCIDVGHRWWTKPEADFQKIFAFFMNIFTSYGREEAF